MNTIDLLGDAVCAKQFIEGSIPEFIDDSIISIGTYAFANCSSLQIVGFPVCTKISINAFSKCRSLQSANFPACTEIGAYAFVACSSLQSANFPACTGIGTYVFSSCSSLQSANFPVCTSIGASAFYGCCSLQTVSFPACTGIGAYAFANCSSLQSANFPACTTINTSAFYGCRSLQTVSFPACITIGTYAFNNCFSLQSANFPACTKIYTYAFCACSSLQSANFPVCTTIDGSRAFAYCSSLQTVNFPACTLINTNTFYDCSSLQIVSFPVCTKISSYAFGYCQSLQSVNFPACTEIGSSAFINCRSLQTISFPACITIGNSAFANCSSLQSIYLHNSFVTRLNSTDAFENTPLVASSYTGTFASVYVSPSLYLAYIADSVWSYFRDRFVPPPEGIYMESTYFLMYKEESGLPVGEIEISAFVTDGLTSCHAVVDDTSYATIKSENQDGNDFTFVVSAVSEGNTTITVSALNEQGAVINAQCSLHVELQQFIYEVQAVSGSAYGFELNSDNYYESKNKGRDNSCAICKLVFSGVEDAITLECINSGEANYDYGLISKLDTMLANSSSADSTDLVFRSFKGASSTSPVTVSVPVTDTNEHYLCIKFIKDASQASGNDSLQFRVVEPE